MGKQSFDENAITIIIFRNEEDTYVTLETRQHGFRVHLRVDSRKIVAPLNNISFSDIVDEAQKCVVLSFICHVYCRQKPTRLRVSSPFRRVVARQQVPQHAARWNEDAAFKRRPYDNDFGEFCGFERPTDEHGKTEGAKFLLQTSNFV